jgi:chromosome segregation ATPase
LDGENSKRRTSERKKQAVNDSDISFSKKHSGLDATLSRDLSPGPQPETPNNKPLTRDQFIQKYLKSTQEEPKPNSKSQSLKRPSTAHKSRRPSVQDRDIHFATHLKTLKNNENQLKADLTTLKKKNSTIQTRLTEMFSKLQSTYRALSTEKKDSLLTKKAFSSQKANLKKAATENQKIREKHQTLLSAYAETRVKLKSIFAELEGANLANIENLTVKDREIAILQAKIEDMHKDSEFRLYEVEFGFAEQKRGFKREISGLLGELAEGREEVDWGKKM